MSIHALYVNLIIFTNLCYHYVSGSKKIHIKGPGAIKPLKLVFNYKTEASIDKTATLYFDPASRKYLGIDEILNMLIRLYIIKCYFQLRTDCLSVQIFCITFNNQLNFRRNL